MDAMTVIPVKRAGTAERALPREDAEDRQKTHLCPAPAVQTAELARPALFADSLAQRTDLLMRRHLLQRCLIRAMRGAGGPEERRDCAAGARFGAPPHC